MKTNEHDFYSEIANWSFEDIDYTSEVITNWIYEDEKLEERITCSKMEHMDNNGKQVYNTKYYDLDMIISTDFRVNLMKTIKFRTCQIK